MKCPCEAVGLTAVSFSDNKRHMPSRMWPSTKWDRHSDTQTGKANTFPCNCHITSPGLVLLQPNKNIVLGRGGVAQWPRWWDGCHPVWEGAHWGGLPHLPATAPLSCKHILTTHPPPCCIAQNLIKKPVSKITELLTSKVMCKHVIPLLLILPRLVILGNDFTYDAETARRTKTN